MARRAPPQDGLFWQRVQPGADDECWVWAGCLDRKGYGRVGIRAERVGEARSKLAHRLSWEVHHGPIPENLCVLHRCDNPPCVNPAHLFLGTKGDNNRDRARKGRSRHAQGEAHYRATLTEASVREMRALRAAGWPRLALAERYGVGLKAVEKVIYGKTWKHVT